MQSLTPKTLAELAQALSAATEKAKIIAGGTDFIIKERAGKFTPDLLIYPGFIPELNTVTKENGVLRIGAAVPMNGITAALKDDKAFCASGSESSSSWMQSAIRALTSRKDSPSGFLKSGSSYWRFQNEASCPVVSPVRRSARRVSCRTGSPSSCAVWSARSEGDDQTSETVRKASF